MQYFFFHLMSWPYLPADFAKSHDSAWVWAPNSLFDPALGPDLYREYLDTLAFADELGLMDGHMSPAVAMVIDPRRPDTSRELVKIFYEPEPEVDWLTVLRRQAKK